MTTYSFIDESGETRLVGTISPAPGGGSQPGAIRVADLGILNVVDLLDGPVTLLTAEDGDFVLFTITNQDGSFVEQDGQGEVLFGQGVTASHIAKMGWPNGTAFSALSDQFLTGNDQPKTVDGLLQSRDAICVAGPIVAQYNAGSTVLVTQTPPAWQANHVYPADFLITENGVFWTSQSGGTSGGSKPVFTNAGDDVMDNDIDWFGVSIPTLGSLHVYALTSVSA